MARRARLPIRLFAAIAVIATLGTGIVSAGSASAESVKQAKAQVAAAQRQLRTLNAKAEAASERYDAARIKLATAQQAASTAQASLGAAQAKVKRLQASVTAFAVAAYRGQMSSTSLLTMVNGSTNKLIGRVSSLQAVSASEAETLASVDAARRVEEQAQSTANAALASRQADTKAMSADRNQVLAAASKERQILNGLQAKEATIIKAAKARAARLAAERAAAALRRQEAAAAAAARAIASQPVSPPAPQPVAGSGGAATAVAWAYREIGKPYVWGAAGPNSFDCSGLAMYVWAKAGVYLEHFTGDQWHEGRHVSRSQLEPGDLVFFAYNTSNPSTIHHVGIYIGGGEMIDAPFTGADVRKDPAFRSDYIGAVRPG
jgi:cell wall-associated NlpC family hydrolase